ncbi:MAG: hypothetical protein CMQ24_13160 [Gammaproteobacteria bacterium]|nr:hypothetical protein [Gammaproteobacteria bacterium]
MVRLVADEIVDDLDLGAAGQHDQYPSDRRERRQQAGDLELQRKFACFVRSVTLENEEHQHLIEDVGKLLLETPRIDFVLTPQAQ